MYEAVRLNYNIEKFWRPMGGRHGQLDCLRLGQRIYVDLDDILGVISDQAGIEIRVGELYLLARAREEL